MKVIKEAIVLVYSLLNHNKLQQFAPAAPDARSSRRCAKR
jgi:hypothetical protein